MDGSELRRRREALGLGRTAFGVQLGLKGAHCRTTISRIEAGRTPFSARLQDLAEKVLTRMERLAVGEVERRRQEDETLAGIPELIDRIRYLGRRGRPDAEIARRLDVTRQYVGQVRRSRRKGKK